MQSSIEILFLILIGLTTISGRQVFQKNSCDCVCGLRGRGNRIVGGKYASPNEYPWTVGLFRQGKLYCGASVISENFLLTAAHCVDGIRPSEIKAYFGGHNITRDFTEVRKISKVYQHEKFNILSFDNDIALLKLQNSIPYGSKIQPACLPDGSTTDYTGYSGIIAGWGRTAEKKETSDTLLVAQVPVWSREQCIAAGYGSKRITENMICSGFNEGGVDACQGDSGGSMIVNGPTGSMEIVGIVSWGRGCARPNLPGIYTNVVNYLNWIQNKIGGECICQPKSGVKSNVGFLSGLFGLSDKLNWTS